MCFIRVHYVQYLPLSNTRQDRYHNGELSPQLEPETNNSELRIMSQKLHELLMRAVGTAQGLSVATSSPWLPPSEHPKLPCVPANLAPFEERPMGVATPVAGQIINLLAFLEACWNWPKKRKADRGWPRGFIVRNNACFLTLSWPFLEFLGDVLGAPST